MSNRHNQMLKWTPAEWSIYNAIQAVEAVGAHKDLTDIVIALGDLKEKLGDYLETKNALEADSKR